ncbi:MAG: hypothetical protein A2075_14065 [Geobacteraceae bacterium GWC2_58_44]|nr:MAG: hypothetical protein A2075_14065 [Geobacteraceae bacterium GWC2_58_44]HBG04295.1 hypothetical protein [Geobacter sp.]
MPLFQEVLSQQPYPCFKLTDVPLSLQPELKKGMLCLYNIDRHLFEFPTVGQFAHAEKLFSYLDFIGYYSIAEFRDLVFADLLPINCPSCKGPVKDAGMISFELEEPGTAEVNVVSGDAEVYVCDFCKRPFAVMPIV